MGVRSILGLGKKNKKEEKVDDKILSEGDAGNILEQRTSDPPEPPKAEIEDLPETIILTSDELGDIFGDKEIVCKTDEVCAYIQKVEIDPSTSARNYTQVKYMGDEYAVLPLNKEEMMQFLPPGKYLVRIMDSKRKSKQFGSATVDIEIPVKDPDEGEVVTSGASATEIALEMARITKENEELKLVANKKPDLGEKALDILFNIATEKLTGKENDKGIDLTDVVGQVTKAIIEGNAAHNTATNEILSSREEHRSQYDLESLKYTHEKDLLKLKKQIEDGTITPDEAQKSSNKIAETIGKIFEGVSKVVQDIRGPLQTLKEIQELNAMQVIDKTKTQPDVTTEHAPGKEEDMTEVEDQTPEMPGYYVTESEGGEFITPDMPNYDERRDPTSENYDPRFDPTQPEYVPPPTEDQSRTSEEVIEKPATGTPDIPVEQTPTDEKDESKSGQEPAQEDVKKKPPPQE